MTTQSRAQESLRRLRNTYSRAPDTFVKWKNPLELVIATVLSAQCTDKRVNVITKCLFKKYRTASDYAKAVPRVLEGEIYSAGFYKSKARYLKGIGIILQEKFKGRVPRRLEDLLTLPGVSYKSAHLVMAKAFGTITGIAVDTHVKRVAPRLGLTKHRDPNKIANDLEKIYTPKDYLDVNEYFIMHGRAICKPRPLCETCVVNDICPFGKKVLRARRRALPSSAPPSV